MIGIFNNKTTKTDLTLYNGEYILDNICTSYGITEELNGEYSLDITFLINDKYNKYAYDLMVNDSLLKVDDEYGIEYFRIAKVTKTKAKYEIFARHITISEPLKMFCEDVRPTNLNGQGAISWIFDNSRGNKWIEVTSNIANTNTAYYKNKTVYEALFDSDNSFLNRWGGEVYRRGFKLSINAKVGEDRGFNIRSGKNLKGIEERSNLNTLVTSIYPTGFDGISIPEKCIDSPLINYYSDIYPKAIKFDDIKVKSENNEEGFDTLEEAQEELRRRSREMFTKDKVDILTSSYTVTFAELQKAEGYKDYSFLETTFLGDIVSVYEEKLNINIKVRVTKRVYDGIKKRRKSTTLSNKDLNYKPPSITQIIEKINKVDSTETILQLAKDNATALIKSGLKNSHVIVRENEIIIGDTKDINTMTKVWRFNNNGLGYSSTGYFGEYGLAMTQDGAIVADFITTGILNAGLIKAGLLESFNGASWLNMENGTFSLGNGNLSYDGAIMKLLGRLESTNNGRSITVDNGMVYAFTDNVLNFALGNNALELYDFYNPAVQTKVGELTSSRNNYSGNLGIALLSDQDKEISIGYKLTPTSFNYLMRFNKSMNYGVQYPINVLESMYLNDSVSLGFGLNTSIGGTSHIKGYNGVLEINLPSDTSNTGLWIKNSYTAQDFAVFQNGSNYKCYMRANTAINGNLHADGNITCNGSKTRVVETDNYGKVRLNAYETPDCLFSDYGNGLIGEDGTCIVTIDDKFLETVNTNKKYRVLLTAIDEEDKFEDIKLKVIKKGYNYFVVKGNVGLEFDWNIVAKQKNYEDDRLLNHDNEILIETDDIMKFNLLGNNETKDNINKIEGILFEK